MWEDFFAIFSENGGYFGGLKKMADVRHPVFPTLADFPYIQGGTLLTIILINHGVPQGSAAAVQEGLTREQEGRPKNECAAYRCPKRQHGEKDAAVDGRKRGAGRGGNLSRFSISVKEQEGETELRVTMARPCEGLSEEGIRRAITAVTDSIAQHLENELVISKIYRCPEAETE